MKLTLKAVLLAMAVAILANAPAWAVPNEYGDEDLSNTGTYAVDPKTGAITEGLAPGAVSFGAAPVGHVYPFAPGAGEYPGTDQIYIGSVQTGFHDGYSVSDPRLNGPQVISLDYSNLVGAGESVATLTLGIAADDFQFPAFGQAFSASINGVADPVLTSTLNSVDQGGPVTQFFTIGIDPAKLTPSHVLTLSIDEGGDGGDGWAIDFLTVGVTTKPVPEPASLLAAVAGAIVVRATCWRRRR